MKRFAFVSGSPALDFVGTLHERSIPEPVELLRTPSELATWLYEAKVTSDELQLNQGDLADATALREAIWSVVASRMDAGRYDVATLALVNDTARNAPPVPQLTDSGLRIEATSTQAFSSLARDAIDVVTSLRSTQLKYCANPGCTQIFLDNSRGGRREWCSMEPCGNKIKARAYRARKALASPAG